MPVNQRVLLERMEIIQNPADPVEPNDPRLFRGVLVALAIELVVCGVVWLGAAVLRLGQ